MKRRSPKRLLQVPEVEAALGVSRSTVWRMIRSGELPTVKVSGRRLVPADGLPQRSGRTGRRPPSAFTREDPLWKLVGAFRSPGGPGATDKHAILDE
ncbi:MAG: helix-turn-helix transcriptional regulator [Myxococcaceae bacterium]